MWIVLLLLYAVGVWITYRWMKKVYIYQIPPATEREAQEAWYMIIVGSAVFPITWVIYMIMLGKR